MIPKIVHIVWFGSKELPPKTQEIINNNKKILGSDWEIKVWKEDDLNWQDNPYTSYWYKKKVWSFVSDYYRAFLVNKYGGFYLDTDIVLTKSLDPLCKYKYVASKTYVVDNTMSIVGSEPNSEILDTYLKVIANKRMIKKPPRIMSTHIHTYSIRKFIDVPDTKETLITNDIALFSEDILQLNVNSNNIAIHEHHDNWKGNGRDTISKWYYKKAEEFNNPDAEKLAKRIKQRNKINKKIDKILNR